MKLARTYLVSGRVQGVGFRYFVERTARQLGVTGWVRNCNDGRVEVYVVATASQQDEIAGCLRQGPPHADVRGVHVLEAPMAEPEGFRIRHG